MTQLLRKPWFAAILLIAAIAMLANSLGLFAGAASPSAPVRARITRVAALSAVRPLLDVEHALAGIRAELKGRNPFDFGSDSRAAALLGPSDYVDHVRLSGLWSERGQTLALINGRICKPGDRVGRIEVAAVNLDGAWLQDWSGRTFLPLGGEFTLRTPMR